MKKLWLALPAIFLAATAAVAQNPRPAPTPTPNDDVVKISTALIQIDVSVTDRKGKPVTDLRKDEVEIYENGEKQKISNFSFVNSVSETTEITPAEKKAEKGAPPVPPVPTVILRPEQVRRTVALVVDDLSLSFESAYQTRRALKKFVDEQMRDGDLVAIIRTGGGIGALQQFTSDRRMLYAAIDKVVYNPTGTGHIGAFAPFDSTDTVNTPSDMGTVPGSGAAPSDLTVGQSLDEFRESVFATGTLGALRYVVTGMGELPGRKSVILFSDGFKLYETNQNGSKSTSPVLQFLRQLVDFANRSSVTFYTVDPRGLQYTGPTAADNVTDAQSFSQLLSDRSAQLFDTQEGLNYLAYETGGFSIQNNNDLTGGVRKILDDQSYYLVGYEPDTDTFDPAKRKFNHLTVKVTRPGVKVRYRSGFFNVASRDQPAANTTKLKPVQQIAAALTSPFGVNGIGLHLNALFGSDQRNLPYVRSLLHVKASDLQFSDEKDGTKRAEFDVLAMSFGDNGQPIDQLAKSYALVLKPERYKKYMEQGFVYYFVFPVRKAGAYQYRVALRDGRSGRIGSANQFIEVPDIKKKQITLSSIVIQNIASTDWQQAIASNGGVPADPMADTALRRVKAGSVLRYGYEIYNAKKGPGDMPVITTQVRVFSGGKAILDGKVFPLDLTGQKDMQHLASAGAITLGPQLPPGDYILQVIVRDTLAKEKQQMTTQYVQFEVVP